MSHSLVLPGQQRDIDHLVVGPGGVTVIDTKAWDGRVWIGRLGLGRGRRAFPHEIDGVSRQINRVHSVLARAGRDDVRITGVLCMVNDNPGIPATGLPEVRGVKVGRPRAVLHHALRDGPLDRWTVEKIHGLLADAFAIHGGSQVPSERHQRRRLVPSKRHPRHWSHRLALGVAGLTIVLVAIAALAHLVPTTVHRLTQPYRAYSRADLNHHLQELRRLAVARAHGKIRGPRVRVTQPAFVLTYRRGKRCRVTVTVSRAAPAFGGGKATVAGTGCRRRP